MELRFTKMHGCGNDYIYVNCFEQKLDEINDKFDFASYYKNNWVSEDRIILRTATAPDREIRK